MAEQRSRRPFKWWHGLLFYAGVLVAEWGIRNAVRRARGNGGEQADRDFYRKQKQPVFAPPGIVFPIAWTLNSICSISGAIHVLNAEDREKGRFLALQGAAWLLFVVFNTAYFELHSPINAAAVTFAYTALTAASIRSAARMEDWRAVTSLLPTAAWLVLANGVAVAVAVWNRDGFWKLGPFADPPEFLLK